MPTPRKLSEASDSIAPPKPTVIETISGPRLLGTRWLRIMVQFDAPSARSASINSFSRSDRICPRTKRAFPYHCTSVNAPKMTM